MEAIGGVATVAQLTGIDAVRLIALIVQAASTARMHKKNCLQLAQHVKIVGNLLKVLMISDLNNHPETREPLEQLEKALKRSYNLINSYQDRSHFYLLAMGWKIVYKFREAQDEIDKFLQIIPLVILADNTRLWECVKDIKKDSQRAYTLDEEDSRMRDVILNPDPSKNDTKDLKKSLSFSYPNLPFNEALQKEKEKLQPELQISQGNLNVEQCKLIQQLIDIIESVAGNSLPEKNIPEKSPSSDATSEAGHLSDAHSQIKIDHQVTSRQTSSVTSRGLGHHEDWQTDLLGCCSEPYLCVKTIFCPCGTIARIATVATNRHTSLAEACNELMAYSLILSCCCYTCCIRRKLRKTMNIAGDFIDDFLSHFMCCCCALVQELREVEIRGVYGSEKTKTSPPISQYMES